MNNTTAKNNDFSKTLLQDFTSGLVVSLVALPLCLGIALASNAPLISGLVAGIIGGLLISWLSGSQTSVSGPAAGLTAVVATQSSTLGSFDAFLTAVMLAGVLQIFLGIFKAGSLAVFFPSSVIKGLLAAIGVILILKQIPHLFGHDLDWLGDMTFTQVDGENTFSELAVTWFKVHPGASLIGLLSISILFFWDRTFLKKIPMPSQLFVVLIGVFGAYMLMPLSETWVIGKSHLVNVPVSASLSALFSGLPKPDLTAVIRPDVYMAAITLCIVATLETLLNLEAVDKIDPKGRVSPPNQELIAQGIGNFSAGLLGALPVTSVIVRSSVNIASGGQTKLASFIHGILLFLAVAFFPQILNLIPLASLAAILLYTGFKLANPKLFKQMWHEGWSQFIPFIVTVVAIVGTDLLTGIVIGLLTSIFFILRSNLEQPIRVNRERSVNGEELVRVELGSHVSFLNRAALEKSLRQIETGKHLMIDARNTRYIDTDVLGFIKDFTQNVAPLYNLTVSLIGFQRFSLVTDRRHLPEAVTAEVQQQLFPEAILERFKEGNERFQRGESLPKDLGRQMRETATKQHPLAVVLSCMDSRVSARLIFDLGLGETFSVKIAGNICTKETLGSLEYGCAMAGAKLLIILGHTQCGAIKATHESLNLESEKLSNCVHIDSITHEISHAFDRLSPRDKHLTDQEYLNRATELNVEHTQSKILKESQVLAKRVAQGDLLCIGGVYNIASGAIKWLE